MPTEDKFKDLFNNPSLENEDWLESGPELLSAITEEIYPQEKKRRRLVFILFFFGLSLSILIFALLKLSNSAKGYGSSEVTSQSSINGAVSSTDNIEASTKDISADIIFENNTSSKPSIENESITSSTDSTKEKVEVAKKYTQVQSSNISSSISELSSASANEYTVSTEVQEIIEPSVPSQNNLKDIFTKSEKLPLSNLSLIPFLNGISISEFDDSRLKKTMESDYFSNPRIDLKNQNKRPWVFEVGAGLSLAKFILNDNYASALDPFDFTHESAQGYFISMSGSKSISQKLNMKLISSFENLKMNSGHNSEVGYTLAEEMNGNTNVRALGMATPLGFINSEIVLQRIADNVDNETTLSVDLQNKHTIRLIELSGVGEYDLISNQRLTLKPSFGFGASYFVQINNNLDTFTPQNPSFTSSTSRITADQTFINKLTPFLDLGFNFSYRLKRGVSTGASYRFKKNLQPVFEQDDFNSTMNRENIGIFLRFDF